MSRLYADEAFPKKASDLLTVNTHNVLTVNTHDVLTVQAAYKANQRIPDDEVLVFETAQKRAVLTVNCADFIRLHKNTSY